VTPGDTPLPSDSERAEPSEAAPSEDPTSWPTEAVARIEAGLPSEGATAPHAHEEIRGEDVSQNPPDEGMEDLPGPSGGEPQEPSG
jgi:hypothetical protein